MPEPLISDLTKDLPAGDIKFEVENTLDGWVGYVWFSPIHGAIAPASRSYSTGRTRPYGTRYEALIAIPEAMNIIKKKIREHNETK